MSRRAKHKAPRKCCGHLHELETAQSDIRLMSKILERATERIRFLEGEIDGNAITQVLSLQQIREQMRRTIPQNVPLRTPEGFTMWLPVGGHGSPRRARPVPSWAARDDAAT